MRDPGVLRVLARAAALLCFLVTATACGPEVDYSKPPERPGCAQPTSVDLGWPSAFGQTVAWFETRGGRVHIEATGINQGGYFDSTVTTVKLGVAASPPVFDEQRRLAGPYSEVRVVDRSYATVTLPAGRYWVTSTRSAHLTVTSCRSRGVAPVA